MRFTSVSPVAVGVALLAACSDASAPANGPLFSKPISIEQFTQTLSAGAARLEIELQPLVTGSPIVAREVEIAEADDQRDEESVEAGAVRFENLETATACRGSIVLGPFTVQFDGATTDFEGVDDADITCAQFVERVQAALTAGESPVVEAERAAPMEPQAPGDAAFAAAELKLENDADAEIEINVDADNAMACSSLPAAPAGCVGVIQVLGVSIAVVDGVTELKSEVENDEMEDTDFEGAVMAVSREGTSCSLGSVTLEDGTVVQIVAATELKNESGDDKQLDDLCAVQEALAAGTKVEADGKGLVSADNSHTILAAEIEFELDEHDDDSSGHGS